MRQLRLDRSIWLLGWMSTMELSFLAETASELKDNSVIFEIGSFCGRSSRALADNSPRDCTIFCIDPWDYEVPMFDTLGNPHPPLVVDDSTFAQFCRNVEDHILLGRVLPIRYKWEDVIWDYRADFIFIDGEHTYEAAKHDIQKAMYHIKPGGIIAGHDYTNFDGVHRAVNECFKKTEIGVVDTIWHTRKS